MAVVLYYSLMLCILDLFSQLDWHRQLGVPTPYQLGFVKADVHSFMPVAFLYTVRFGLSQKYASLLGYILAN